MKALVRAVARSRPEGSHVGGRRGARVLRGDLTAPSQVLDDRCGTVAAMTSIPSNLARLLAGGCALALTMAACGGSDDTSGGTGSPPSAAAAAASDDTGGDPTTTAAGEGSDDTAGEATDESDDGGSGDAARWLSPLDEFLGFGVEPSAEQQAEWDQQQRQMEQLIAACMNAQGFEYTALDPSSAVDTAGPWDLPPDEFAQQYGYGITTIERDAYMGNDPNAAAVEAMSVPEKQAYYEALYGSMITVDENGDMAKREPMPAAASEPDTESCSAQASTEVYGDRADAVASDGENDAFAPLQQEMSALYERVEGDQRVVDARTAWSSCMADAGHPGLADIYDGSTEVSDRATALMGETLDPAAADPAAVEELRTYEIAVATADLACRVDYDAVHQEVQTELEQSFIDEHRAELEQYRDAIAAGSVGAG
jgi:hypothetical protein